MYQGVKFEIEMISNKVPNDPRLEDLKYWCKVFDDKKLAPPYEGGSYGNLSYRYNEGENQFIITCSATSLCDKMNDECFAKVILCDLDRGIVKASGVKNPSSESMLHHAIYKFRPDINAIFHGHYQEILNKAADLQIPETKTQAPYGTAELVESVLEILDNHNFLIMKDHGFLSLGESMQEAGEIILNKLIK